MDAPIVPVVPAAPVANADVKVDAVAKPANDIASSSPKEVEKAIEKIKLGEGEEYTVAELRAFREKAKGADKRFLEAAQTRKSAMLLHKMAKEDPRGFLEKTGMDPKKFAYDEVAKDIQDKLRDPKEVQLEKAEARLKEFEAKETAEKERVQSEKLAKQAKAMEERFHAEAIKALEAHPAIPKNGFSVAKMAKYIEVVQQKTGERLSFEEVAGVIENDIKSEVTGIVKGATAEQIMALIGEEGMAAIRQYDLARLKNPLAGGNGSNGQPKKTEDRKPQRSRDVWKAIDDAAAAEGYNKFGQKVR